MAAVVNQCADYFEGDRYVLPSEKHCLLRVMSYGLFLMDGDNNTQYNIFKSKKIKLNRFATIFRKYPIVPLYGDMQITLESMIRRSPHFDEKIWGISGTDSKLALEYEIINSVESTKLSHNEYMSKFANMINELRVMIKQNKQIDSNYAREVYNLVHQGITLLSDWTSKVLFQSAWKYAKPNNDESVETTVEYERVVRFNYKPEEKVALVEFISMIKGLAHIMLKEDALLSPIIRNAIHEELQLFIQMGLRDIIRHATSKKKKDLRNDLLQLRFIGADWSTGIEPQDPSLQGKKPPKDDKISLPTRAVAPSATQLELIRNITFNLLTKTKDIKSKHEKVLQEFYNKSFYYTYLLSYSNTILSITDLGDLWYREFYLELSKRLQFPIDMSLPWILTDNILESKEASLMEFVFYPLDLYNDAAHRALNSLKVQFLYDEIEAEVNLCFDQLVYKLSEQIYGYFKTQASSILLDKPYKIQLEQILSAHKLHVPRSRYDVILRQRNIQLLGRSIDLNYLIGQRMNTYLRQNIEHAISRFEASDITGVVELERLLNNIKFTYTLLRDYFEIDSWESILSEVNESISLMSYHGRIVLHIIFEIVYDFAPNHCYNAVTNRFVRKNFTSEEVPRDAMPRSNVNFLYGTKLLVSAYQNSDDLYKKFVGQPHVDSIVNLVGKSHMPLVISECLQNIDLKIRNVLVPYVRELMGGMPPSSKLPSHDYGTEGGYGYFEFKFRDIITYPDLRPEVLQNFREFGNILVFMKMCDGSLAKLENNTFIISSPFLGIYPEKPLDNSDPSSTSPLYSSLNQVANFLESHSNLSVAPQSLKEIVSNAWKADKLYRNPTQNFSLFKYILNRLRNILDAVKSEWSGSAPDNGVLNVDHSTEFYRLWSALQFVCCLPTPDNEESNLEIFGDGLMWAGCSIIHFLKQQHRFEVFDFSYHILNVEESAPAPCNRPNIHQFFKKVALVRDLNQTVFNTLKAHIPIVMDDNLLLHPPKVDNFGTSEAFISADTSNSANAPSNSSSTLRSNSSYSNVPPPPNNTTTAPPPPALPQRSVFTPPPPVDDIPPPPPPDEAYTDDPNDLPPPPPPHF